MIFNKLTTSDFGVIALTAIVFLIVVVGVLVPWISPYDPSNIDLSNVNSRPSLEHIFGTDMLGRDLLSRVIWGTQISLIVMGSSVILAIVIGGGLAIWSGYRGGIADVGVTALFDLLYSFPLMLLALFIMASFGRSISTLVLAVGLGLIPTIGRVSRAEVLKLRGEEYISSARSMGASRLHILRKHIIPNMAPMMLVLVTMTSVYALLIEASLSFLGLGLPPPTPSWGSIVADGKPFLLKAPWISASGGLSISFLVITVNLLGDRLRDRLQQPRRNIK